MVIIKMKLKQWQNMFHVFINTKLNSTTCNPNKQKNNVTCKRDY